MTRPKLPKEVADLIAEENRRRREAVSTFVSGVANADMIGVVCSIELLDSSLGAWSAAFRKVARLGPVDPDVKAGFVRFWMRYGDALRQDAGTDLELLDALRVLLPSYEGSAVTLYRGETAWNRKHRTYGLSWTTSRDVADDFARRDMRRSGEGGTVVLRTLAPPEAIVCALHLVEHDRYAEEEVIVDRRRLGRVDVLCRYEQVPAGQPR